MDIDEDAGKLLQKLGIHRFAVYLADTALGHDTTLQNDQAVLFHRDVQLLHPFQLSFLFQMENQLNQGIIGSCPDQITIAPASQREPHRTYDDGFSCAGFTCQDVQTGPEIHLGLLNQCQIFNM